MFHEYHELEVNARLYGLSKADYFRFLAIKEHANRLPNPGTFSNLRADISGAVNNNNQAVKAINRAIKIYDESSGMTEVQPALGELRKQTRGIGKMLLDKSVLLDEILKQYR